ncbi:hypothetical protein [Actinoplanes regularis]|uniref:hypothetical protein n=1 Tax=Actinoplanes regularis TaxID=52697 RepID=UPI00249FDAEE|nr:hypothetical protein [Actinoplanes regularis]GLW28509.1 hypothetical protein Areg01_14490 [Actinoplanes regularis]
MHDGKADGDSFTTRGGVAFVDRAATPRRLEPAPAGGWYVTWPFARLRIDAHGVEIASMFGDVTVTRDNLVSISRFRRVPILSDGFKFDVADRDDAVVFWALNPSTVLRRLREHHWPVRGDA